MTASPATLRRLPAIVRAWIEEARDELKTLGMAPGFVRHYPITAAQYRDLAERCPLPEDDEEAGHVRSAHNL